MITPNRLEQVTKACDQWEGIKVPQEIRKDEAHLYHLLNVDRMHLEKQQTYVNFVRVIKMNQKDYISKVLGTGKIKMPFMAMNGYKNLFPLHDPTVKTEVKSDSPLTAKEVAKAISLCETIEDAEKLVGEDEERTTVLEAFDKKIKELTPTE